MLKWQKSKTMRPVSFECHDAKASGSYTQHFTFFPFQSTCQFVTKTKVWLFGATKAKLVRQVLMKKQRGLFKC